MYSELIISEDEDLFSRFILDCITSRDFEMNDWGIFNRDIFEKLMAYSNAKQIRVGLISGMNNIDWEFWLELKADTFILLKRFTVRREEKTLVFKSRKEDTKIEIK